LPHSALYMQSIVLAAKIVNKNNKTV